METNPFIKRLKLIVLENFTNEQFGVGQLAEQYGMSRSQLHRKLKSATGQSLSQFIREIRLEEALKMLQNEDLSASEVSYKVGFNSPSYFNTCFHAYFGYTPGEVYHMQELAQVKNNISHLPQSRNHFFTSRKKIIIWLPIIIILASVLYVYSNLNSQPSNTVKTNTEKAKSIAVLPLKNWSGDVDLEHISDGMTDAIISKLSNLKEMERVVPYTSTQKYKDSHLSVQEIAQDLDVEYILEGSFKLAGNHLQFNVNLIEVDDNNVIWTEEYNRIWESENIFNMQANVAKNIADNLKLDLDNNELSTLQFVPTENTEAYSYYLRGKFQHEKLSPDGFKNAISLFESAIALDSTFVLPYFGLTQSYLLMGFVWGGKNKQTANDNTKKYFELASKFYDSKNKQQYESLRQLKMDIDFALNWDFESVYNELMTNGHAGSCGIDIARKLGEYELAIKIGENSEWANDGDGLFDLTKAQILMMSGKNQEALNILDELNPLNRYHYFYLMESAKIYYYLMDFEKSKQQLDRFMELFDENPSQILWLAAVHAEMDGDATQAKEYLSRLKSNLKAKQAGSPAWFLAMYYCHIKDYDKVFTWLNKSYELHEVEMTWLREEPLLRPLRNDPRYIRIYDKVGFSKALPITPYLN